jgi:hypothetical protein
MCVSLLNYSVLIGTSKICILLVVVFLNKSCLLVMLLVLSYHITDKAFIQVENVYNSQYVSCGLRSVEAKFQFVVLKITNTLIIF